MWSPIGFVASKGLVQVALQNAWTARAEAWLFDNRTAESKLLWINS